MKLTIEEEILFENFKEKPDFLHITQTPENFRAKMFNAHERPDFFFSKCSYEDIYYGYLRKAWDATDMDSMEKKMVMEMLRDGRSYREMACILSFSPKFSMKLKKEPSQEERWEGAVSFLSDIVNPVLSFSEVMDAPPLPRLEEKLATEGSHGTSLAKSYYLSALKSVLLHDPSLRIQEADAVVSQILLLNGHPKEFILSCMRESYSLPRLKKSLNIKGDMEKAEKELCAELLGEGAERLASLGDSRPKTKNPPRIPEPEPEKEHLVEEMNKKIKEMISKEMNIVEFWEKTMDTIKDAMISFQKARTAARILHVWSVGLGKLEEGFGMRHTREAQNIAQETHELLKKDNLEEIEGIFEQVIAHMNTLEKLTNKAVSAMSEKPHENPLLALPAIRAASPLQKSMVGTLPPNALYVSAIKLAVLKNDALPPQQADMEAAKLLSSMGASKRTIMTALEASPCLSHLPQKKKEDAIRRLGTDEIPLPPSLTQR